MREIDTRTLILNRLWNLKVDEVQRIVAELEALCSYLGMDEVNLKDCIRIESDPDRVVIKGILEAIFTQVIGRSKAI